MKKDYTINQCLDKLLTKYNSYNQMSGEVRALYDKLIEAKYKYGGRQAVHLIEEHEKIIINL